VPCAAQTVCRRIVELAHDHGARVVAQGVETRADFIAAHGLGFDLMQGYLFNNPMGVEKFARPRPVLLSSADQRP
jgi:EAL domain-containing protein (putative c-di-GMP-specific phosphodiesterase class I)